MDILKHQVVVAIGVALKEAMNAENLNLAPELASDPEVTKVGALTYQVKFKTHRGPRYFTVKTTEKV
jgi:hypothetical protein